LQEVVNVEDVEGLGFKVNRSQRGYPNKKERIQLEDHCGVRPEIQ
jgi:hypothetical protein